MFALFFLGRAVVENPMMIMQDTNRIIFSVTSVDYHQDTPLIKAIPIPNLPTPAYFAVKESDKQRFRIIFTGTVT